MHRFILKTLIITALLLGNMAYWPALADTPIKTQGPTKTQDSLARDIVGSFQDALLQSMKAKDSWSANERTAHIEKAVTESFDLVLMIRLITGKALTQASPAERRDLLDAFQAMTVRNYASQFNSFSGQQFEITGAKKGPQDTTLVETLIKSGAEAHKLTYVLRKNREGTPLIIDILLGDSAISQLSVRRSEYAATLKTGGVMGLTQALNQKNEPAKP